jgi:hypothetical protein
MYIGSHDGGNNLLILAKNYDLKNLENNVESYNILSFRKKIHKMF